MMTKGMSRRLRTSSKPYVALLARHIEYLGSTLERRYTGAISVVIRLEIPRAGLVNLVAWLAWLRSMELFTLRWLDMENVAPTKVLRTMCYISYGLSAKRPRVSHTSVCQSRKVTGIR
jgi:hypothetical protein